MRSIVARSVGFLRLLLVARPRGRGRKLRLRRREIRSAVGRHGLGVLVGARGFGRVVPFHWGLLGHQRRAVPYTRAEHVRLALAGLLPRLEKDAAACLLTGQLIGWGADISRDQPRAEELFHQSWTMDCSDAANQIGLLFNEGEPSRRNKVEAVRWFR